LIREGACINQIVDLDETCIDKLVDSLEFDLPRAEEEEDI
jgi:hypothetical protein